MVEVPDCAANLTRQDYTMIWEEHTLYFTRDTLPHAIRAAGFEILSVEIHPFAFEDVIVLYARKGAGAGPRWQIDAAACRRNVELADAYGSAFEGWTERYRSALEGLAQGRKRLAAYGAGHLTSAFINFHGFTEQFAFVVDDTPHKQGLYLPKCALPIVPKEWLTNEDIGACLFGLAPEIEDKVIAANPRYVGSGGSFFSMFVDSSRSIRGLA